MYTHKIVTLSEFSSEIEELLNNESKEGWEVVTIFYAKLGVADESLFALLREKA